MAIVGLATVLGQVLLAAALPVSARLYGPYAMGVFASVLVAGQFGSILMTGRIEQVLPRLVRASVWRVLVALMLGCSALAIPVGTVCALAAGYPEKDIVASSTGLVFAIAIYGVVNMGALAEQEYRKVAALRALNGSATAILQIVGGVIAPSASTLILSYALGNLIASTVGIPVVARLFDCRGEESIADVFRKERLLGFAGAVGTSALLSSATLGLPVVALGHMFGEELAASFFITRRLLMVPVQLVSRTVNEVGYAVLAKRSVVDISLHVSRWLKKLLLAAVAVCAVGVVGAPIVALVLGPEYEAVALVMILQCLPVVGQLLGGGLGNVLLALEAERIRLLWNLIRFGGLLLTVIVTWYLHVDYVGVVAAISIVTFFGMMGLLRATLMELKSQRMEYLADAG